MLSEQEIQIMFVNKLDQSPTVEEIELFKDHDQESLESILDRQLAIKNDPTYIPRVVEDYLRYMNASLEEQRNWKPVDPL